MKASKGFFPQTNLAVSVQVVLDTNIISRYPTPRDRIDRIVDLCKQGGLEVVVSEVVLRARVRGGAALPMYGFTDVELMAIDSAFEEFTKIVTPTETAAGIGRIRTTIIS